MSRDVSYILNSTGQTIFDCFNLDGIFPVKEKVFARNGDRSDVL